MLASRRFALAAVLFLAGCQNNPAVVPEHPPAEPESPARTATPAAPPTAATDPGQWMMPDLVGSNLQEAQDKIQALTAGALFVTTSHDATAQHRNQVRDANWKVCSQNIAPGAPINAASKIDFGAVKLDERCP